jgi:ribosomal protein S18 acetylase RimI-like enzyme
VDEITDAAELAGSCDGDPMTAGIRAWRLGGAVAVASPGLCRRDRLALYGPADDAAALTAGALGALGPAYRPFGDESLVRRVAELVPGLTVRAFGWMDTETLPDRLTTAHWLTDDTGVAEVLEDSAPDSYAWPGAAGVRRWAAITDDSGPLSVAADAWSAPAQGFLAGVATRRSARGRGLSGQVCAFVTAELVKRHGRCGLMVDTDNAAAIAVYQRLGYTYRPVAAAWLGG